MYSTGSWKARRATKNPREKRPSRLKEAGRCGSELGFWQGKFLNSWKKNGWFFKDSTMVNHLISPCFSTIFDIIDFCWNCFSQANPWWWGFLGFWFVFLKNPCGSPFNDWGMMARTFRGTDKNREFDPFTVSYPTYMLRIFECDWNIFSTWIA